MNAPVFVRPVVTRGKLAELHDNVAAALAYFGEPETFKPALNLSARDARQLGHAPVRAR